MLEEVLSILQTNAHTNADVAKLAALLNHLILHDFERLVQLLYRVDVPEREVRHLLRQQPAADAGLLLAHLLLKRTAEKEAIKNRYRQADADIPDEERW